MQIELSTLVAIAVTAAGGIVWLVRLEGRVNLAAQRHDDIIGRLDRMEDKIDRITK